MSTIPSNLRVQREIEVRKTAQEVWAFVSDMGNWASQMPGYLSHQQIDRDNSIWTLHVDIGPFQRPVPIDVHVLKWDEPGHVSFKIRGKEDPFIGEGTFTSTSDGATTQIVLEFGAQPTGSMARMLVPLVPPILQRTADQFTANLLLTLNGEAKPLSMSSRAARRGFWAWLLSQFAKPKASRP